MTATLPIRLSHRAWALRSGPSMPCPSASNLQQHRSRHTASASEVNASISGQVEETRRSSPDPFVAAALRVQVRVQHHPP